MNSKINSLPDLLQWSAQNSGLAIIGVDEAGRGCLCGPVFASAVCFKSPIKPFASDIAPASEREFESPTVTVNGAPQHVKKSIYKDSKLLSSAQRDKFYEEILASHWVGVGSASSTEVDRLNILQASLLAMKRAVEDLVKNFKSCEQNINSELIAHVVIDGHQKIPGFNLFAQSTQVKGDQLVYEISAASIVAKVSRDRYVDQLNLKYPEYEFSKHKGYGTALHKAKIEEFGPCPEHRITFKGVREFLHIKSQQSYQGTVV